MTQTIRVTNLRESRDCPFRWLRPTLKCATAIQSSVAFALLFIFDPDAARRYSTVEDRPAELVEAEGVPYVCRNTDGRSACPPGPT